MEATLENWREKSRRFSFIINRWWIRERTLFYLFFFLFDVDIMQLQDNRQQQKNTYLIWNENEISD